MKPIAWPPAWPVVAQLKLKPLTKPRLVSVSANSMPISAPMKPMWEPKGSSTQISEATSVWCMRLRPTWSELLARLSDISRRRGVPSAVGQAIQHDQSSHALDAFAGKHDVRSE